MAIHTHMETTTLQRTPPDWINRTRQRTRAARVAAGLCMICGGSMEGCKPKHIRCFKCRMARSVEYYANKN